MRVFLIITAILFSEVAISKDIIKSIILACASYENYLKCQNTLLVIGYTESGLMQVNSSGDNDIGIFQIHKNEIKREGYDRKALEKNIPYQVYVASDILNRKKMECKNKYPKTWLACYNSASPKQHQEYWKKLNRSAEFLGIDIRRLL